MKTLSVKQPWAWAIAKGYKTIENRSRATSHRGPLAIHASQRWDEPKELWLASRDEPTVVCDCGPWANAAETHWQLANARLLPEPFAAKGRLGLWDCDLPSSAPQEGEKP